MPVVSMKSGLEDRNNTLNPHPDEQLHVLVSMKSGLEDRNNGSPKRLKHWHGKLSQ